MTTAAFIFRLVLIIFTLVFAVCADRSCGPKDETNGTKAFMFYLFAITSALAGTFWWELFTR